MPALHKFRQNPIQQLEFARTLENHMRVSFVDIVDEEVGVVADFAHLHEGVGEGDGAGFAGAGV